MNVREQLVNGPGYCICTIDNIQLFEKLRDSFVNSVEIPTEKIENIGSLRKLLLNMSLAEINRARVSLLKLNHISEMMVESCANLVETLCGIELFIQRRANIIFNIPGNQQLRIWSHYEITSGISPFTYGIWAPFHDLEDDGGVYFLDQKASIDMMKEEEAEGQVNGPTVLGMDETPKPIRLKFGQVVVFNPFVLHGNVAFNSRFSRIGCSVRFQSCKKPLLQKNSDYLKYYRLV